MSAAIAAVAVLSAVPALNRIDIGSLALFWLSTLALALVTAASSSHFEHLIKADYSIHIWLLPAFMILSSTLALALKVLHKSHLAKALYVHSLNGFYVSEFDMTHKAGRV